MKSYEQELREQGYVQKASADYWAQLKATIERLEEKFDHVETAPLEKGGIAVFVK